jgi:hypothetical protein
MGSGGLEEVGGRIINQGRGGKKIILSNVARQTEYECVRVLMERRK